MKKRILALMLTVALCVGMFVMPASAADSESVAYLTISVAGQVKLARVPVPLQDANENAQLDIDDVLQVGHALYADEDCGYLSTNTPPYGLGISELWGDTSGAFGYCLNNSVPMSLEENVTAGDEVYAYVYQDGKGYTDAFSFFDRTHVSAKTGDTVTLTLSKTVYDPETWVPSNVPVAGATVTLDGAVTGQTTDADGKVTLTLNASGLHVISATVEDTFLVPPICTVRVKSTLTSDWRSSAMLALQGTVALSLAKDGENISFWDMIGLYGAGVCVPDAYLSSFVENLYDALVSGNGQLSSTQYTAYSRNILALTAAGEDASQFAGYDLVHWLEDYDKTTRQGITGVAYALLALDCAGTQYSNTQRENYVQYILDEQRKDGGWDLRGESASSADTDVTAICLQALAAYTDTPAVQIAVNKGLACLSALQKADGSFASYGVANCESCAVVLLAMCQLGIGLDDARFMKDDNTVLDAMLRFRNTDNSFSHILGKDGNTLATTQAQAALVSLLRCADGLPGIYDMTDSYGDFPFTDVSFYSWYFDAVRYTNRAGMLAGTDEATFSPEENLTRGMLVAVLWRMMGCPDAENQVTAYYSDVNEAMYYATAIAWATEQKIAFGSGNKKFEPDENVTREQMACYFYRYQQFALQRDVSASASLSGWSDCAQISSWSKDALRWATAEGIIVGDKGILDPLGFATRAQVASVLTRYDRAIAQAEATDFLNTYYA